MKYRKKPVVIEAFQMTKQRRWDFFEWPEWLSEAWEKEERTIGSVYPLHHHAGNGNDELYIATLEGTMEVSVGDWIIQGIQGELYPCKPDIFDATYEPVDG